MKYIVFIIKRIVMAICLLYAVDLIISSTGYLIPINIISITSVSILGLPAIISLVILNKLL